jgi:ABC-2 type transport system ATP-binding protein
MVTEHASALRAQNIVFSVNRKRLLDGVGFEIGPGTCFAVIGHNGAGKTTLFHLLLGLKFPDRGSIEIFGEPAESPRSRRSLSYVPERPYFNLELRFSEALRFHAGLLGLDFRTCRVEVARAASAVGLESHLDQALKTFSKGMLQKAMIAQALLGNPQVLVLDEPMSGLDPEARETVKRWIREWKAAGRTVVFSTHALEDVESLADRVLVLKSGRMDFIGDEKSWKERA